MRQVGEAAEQAEAAVCAAFQAGVADVRAGQDEVLSARREFSFEDVPAPRTLAPHAVAVAASVQVGDQDLASGRLVLLYDPAGQPGWEGTMRVIVYIQADLEPEIAADPLLGQVGWSWLTEALDERAPGYARASGTVTRVVTEGFGAKREEGASTSFELRASWSPVATGRDLGLPPGPAEAGLAGHVTAWCGAMCAAAGLPPLAAGVAALRPPTRRRP